MTVIITIYQNLQAVQSEISGVFISMFPKKRIELSLAFIPNWTDNKLLQLFFSNVNKLLLLTGDVQKRC